MNQELVVAVLVQAFQTAAIAADAVHARRRVAREFNPFRFQRVELRMNDGARKWNGMPAGSIEASGNQAALGAGFERGREPLAIAADGALAQLGAGVIGDATLGQRVALDGLPVDGPQAAAAGEDQGFPIRMQRRRKGWMASPLVICRGVSESSPESKPESSEASNNWAEPVRYDVKNISRPPGKNELCRK